jgi:hypothetical protein
VAAVSITPADLAPFAEIPQAKAEAMIADALALAARVAPCITDADFAYPDAAKAILRSAVLRWNDRGSGALTQETLGSDYSYSTDTRDSRGNRSGLFWPSEIEALQDLCKGEDTSGAYAIDTSPLLSGVQHSDICALNFGGLYCSCGAVLTQNLPLYEWY